MAKDTPQPAVSDASVRELLERYHCPVPFHTVRTRFLGNLASPNPQASPVQAIAALWGGELPVLETEEAVNELIGGLMMGLWNSLSRHLERSSPFRLIRIEVPGTREGLAGLALMREQELDGFREGLFGDAGRVNLPERAHKALRVLAELRTVIEAARAMAERPPMAGEGDDVAGLLQRLRKLTQTMEHEMHEAVLACTRARRTLMPLVPTTRPVVH